jgi:hypothetical protein
VIAPAATTEAIGLLKKENEELRQFNRLRALKVGRGTAVQNDIRFPAKVGVSYRRTRSPEGKRRCRGSDGLGFGPKGRRAKRGSSRRH